jgi:integrase
MRPGTIRPHTRRIKLRECGAWFDPSDDRSGFHTSPSPTGLETCKPAPVDIRWAMLGDCDKYRDWRLSGGYVSSYKVRGGHPKTMRTSGGNRSVDLELTVVSNVFNLAVRQNVLTSNPFKGRGRCSLASEIRHCREVAPRPEGLKQIESYLRFRSEQAIAAPVCFLAYSGLRVGEALPLTWGAVSWGEEILHVRREKRGITPWVPILSEMAALLKDMKQRATGDLLFPSPFDWGKPRDVSAIRHRITAACKKLEIGHVTPHGLRSYFVTQARQSGLTDAEIAALIGDKTGPAIIATTYGDVRDDHLLKQAQRIRLTVQASHAEGPGGS